MRPPKKTLNRDAKVGDLWRSVSTVGSFWVGSVWTETGHQNTRRRVVLNSKPNIPDESAGTKKINARREVTQKLLPNISSESFFATRRCTVGPISKPRHNKLCQTSCGTRRSERFLLLLRKEVMVFSF